MKRLVGVRLFDGRPGVIEEESAWPASAEGGFFLRKRLTFAQTMAIVSKQRENHGTAKPYEDKK